MSVCIVKCYKDLSVFFSLGGERQAGGSGFHPLTPPVCRNLHIRKQERSAERATTMHKWGAPLTLTITKGGGRAGAQSPTKSPRGLVTLHCKVARAGARLPTCHEYFPLPPLNVALSRIEQISPLFGPSIRASGEREREKSSYCMRAPLSLSMHTNT